MTLLLLAFDYYDITTVDILFFCKIFDAGEYFLLTPDEENLKLKVVAAKEDGIKCLDSNAVFLIDHAWTYKEHDARKLLCEIPGSKSILQSFIFYEVACRTFTGIGRTIGVSTDLELQVHLR